MHHSLANRSTNRSTNRPMRVVALGTLALIGVLAPQDARADLIIDQPDSPANGLASQEFPDFPAFACSAFDDVTLTQAYDLTSLVVFGQDGDGGGSIYNADVRLRILAQPDLTATPIATVSGIQTGGALVWDLTGITLGPGTYWISAQVVRPFEPGGQWYWRASNTTNGAHAMWHNPGGGFGIGTEGGGDPAPYAVRGIRLAGRRAGGGRSAHGLRWRA